VTAALAYPPARLGAPSAPANHRSSHTAARTAGLILRRCACGGSCPRCRASAAHPRLAVNTPGDAFEREADRAADAVMSASPAVASTSHAPPALRRCACGGSCPACRKEKEEALHRQDGGGGGAPGFAPPVVHQVLASPGRPLDAAARGRMEAGFGADFGGVRVHDDARAAESARAVDAHAYTVGSDIVFAASRYAPGTAAGDRLLAHELAHTLQQGGVAHRLQRQETSITPPPYTPWRERSFGMVPQLQLSIDPELELMWLRMFMRIWLGSTLTTGTPSVPPTAGAGAPPAAPPAADQPAAGGAPSAGQPAAPTAVPPPSAVVPSAFRDTPPSPGGAGLPPAYDRPLADGALGQPNVGSMMAPYGLRGVPLAARDPAAAQQIWDRNWRFVTLLPDIRDLAPAPIRRLIPANWRYRMTDSFTAATVDAQIRLQYPTPIELSDRFYFNVTGVQPTYISFPGISF
jgi:hypothetical protein